MSKKKDTLIRQGMGRRPAWLSEWCMAHQDELEDYRGMVVAVHKEHGIISAARTMSLLWGHARFLKKRLLEDTVYVHTADHTKMLDDEVEDDDSSPSFEDTPMSPTTEAEPHDVEDAGSFSEWVELPPPLAPDPFDNDVILDGSKSTPVEEEQMTILRFSQKHSVKATEVLIKVLSWGKEGVHINSPLDSETLLKLEAEFKVGLTFPSPDKQPPFMPCPSSAFDRGILIDGASSGHRRSPHFD